MKQAPVIDGLSFDAFNEQIINQAAQSNWMAHSDAEGRETRIGATIGALGGMGPRDEVEGMLAAQMIGLHNASTECIRRAMLAKQTAFGRDISLKHAAKLSRTFAQLQAAFD